MQPQSSFAKFQAQPAFGVPDPTREYYSGFEYPIAMGVNDITQPPLLLQCYQLWVPSMGLCGRLPMDATQGRDYVRCPLATLR
ncbi:hypothetical protein CORC01_10763 [Colletotrichum orchidophilum]|uniref:Uncharacterized protein n=1 Tax=Colletotrichum orchidophilum TaxID=1209926 RepID=A0A1G4AXX9_9PEZI|nr:uncharacterized protein CORC01_10763 [Colletotrichum orchidophilum]OHE93976.1 hypothetical protein CORC01_10763 [Colletotrichum orchidophilum]